mgnify:CR=1 FL=1
MRKRIVLDVQSVSRHFGGLKAVDGVSLSVSREATLGVIGENGCGKSVTAQSVLRIVPNNGDALIGLAETYRMRGDRARALEHYERYLAELPGGAKAQMARQEAESVGAWWENHGLHKAACRSG